jgi:hypothetical protein
MARSIRTRDAEERPIHINLERELRFLSASQVAMIDDVLMDVSPYGEVRLRLRNGELSFIAQTKSYDAYKLQQLERPDEDLRGREIE